MGGGGGGGGDKWRAPGLRGDESLFLAPADAPPALAALARALAALGPRLRAQGGGGGGGGGCWAEVLRPGGRVELQLARYTGVGRRGGGGGGAGGGVGPVSFPRYARHADNGRGGGGGGRTGASRAVTAVLYLGDGGGADEEAGGEGGGWDARRDGGELALYLPGVYCTGGGGGGGGGRSGGGGGGGKGDGEPSLRVAPVPGRLALFDSAVEHEVLPVTAPAGRSRVALTAWFHRHSDDGGDKGRGGAVAAAAPPQQPPPLPAPPTPMPAPPPTTPLRQPPLAADLAATILVTVASFRDPETAWTLRDVFSKASDPGRLRAAVVWQDDDDDDGGGKGGGASGGNGVAGGPSSPAAESSARLPPAAAGRVRHIRLPSCEAAGPGVARHLALAALWRGEAFVLQLDSHTRLRQAYDESLVLILRAAERASAAADAAATDAASARATAAGGAATAPEGQRRQALSRGAVISTYPPPYEGSGASARVPELGPATTTTTTGAAALAALAASAVGGGAGETGGEEEEQDVTALCASSFSGRDGLLRLRCRRVRPDRVASLAVGRGPDPDDPSRFCPGVLPAGGFWAAGFSFSRGAAAVRDAPFCCPRLRHLFFGEEAYGLARLHTGGYDVYAPARCVAWHQWGVPRAERAARASCSSGARSAAASAAAAAAAAGSGPAAAAAGAGTYAALVAGDARARRERAASERRVRALLAGEALPPAARAAAAREGTRGGGGAAVETLWWRRPAERAGGDGDGDEDGDNGDDADDWAPGGRWGLGTRRSLDSLYARCGVDFRRLEVGARAQRGGLPQASFVEDED